MRVLWSKNSKKVHKYADARVDERCNTNQILDEDRMDQDVPDDPTLWAQQEKLTLCKRCFK